MVCQETSKRAHLPSALIAKLASQQMAYQISGSVTYVIQAQNGVLGLLQFYVL